MFDTAAKRLHVVKKSLAADLDAGYLSEPEPIEFPTSNGLTAYALFYAPKNNDFAAPAGELPPQAGVMILTIYLVVAAVAGLTDIRRRTP